MWHILGIKPTTDIKTIKSAYAKLAKQYNPEEYPEEFQKIFDAYKSACAYAKRNRPIRTTGLTSPDISQKQERKEENTVEKKLDFSGVDTSRKHAPKEEITDDEELNFSGVDTSRKHPPREEGTAEDELDFSDVDTSRKHPPREEGTAEDELDFSGVDTSRKHPPREEGTAEDELDFSDVDTSRKHPHKKEISDEDELDFSDVDTSPHPIDNDIPATPEETPAFDFSGVNDKYDESDEKKRIISLRIRLTERLRKLAANGTLAQWKEFFEKTHFDELANDFVFRTNAAKLLNGRAFKKEISQLIAEKFGNGTTISRLSLFSGLYQVFIPVSTQPFPEKKPKKKPSLFAVAAVIVCILINIPQIMILFDTFSSYKNDPVSSENPYADERYSELYKSCVGRWDFSFGHIEFFEANFFEMDYRGEIYRGAVVCTDADNDDLLSIILSAPDTEIDGFTGSVKLFYKDGKSMVIKNKNGKIFMGKYAYDENTVTE